LEAPLGKALIIPDSQKYILSQRVVAFKTIPEVNNLFLIQLVWSDLFQHKIKKLSTGGTVKGINQKSLKKIIISFPDYTEQQKIADFLTSIDNLIEAKQEQITNAEKWKKGLMQQLFI